MHDYCGDEEGVVNIVGFEHEDNDHHDEADLPRAGYAGVVCGSTVPIGTPVNQSLN